MPDLDCVPVKLRTLPLGICLKCKIYFKKPQKSNENSEAESLLCENQTVTQSLIDRLKRTIFPDTKVYIPRQYVIESLFDKGHLLEFNEEEIKAIRNLESPWEKKKSVKVTIPPPPAKKADEPKPKTDDRAKVLENKVNTQKLREVVRVYDKSKQVTQDMLDHAAKTGKIDQEHGKTITKNIKEQIESTDVSLIIQTINRIRTVDEYLHTHCLNVAFLNGLMGKWLKFDPVRQNEMVEVGLFHDLGKLGIDPHIIHKSDDLTPEEFLEMKKHPVLSLEMLMKSGVRNKEILEGVTQHHERNNGTGYPRGVGAKDICEYARITAITDTYDAMVTKRVHSDSHSPFVILGEFDRGGYSELDFNYVSVFISCMIEELKGKQIIMNDGREATVLLVNPSRLLYPIVEIDGQVVKTNDDLYCVRMKNVLG